jgi:serine/threonine protein kinase
MGTALLTCFGTVVGLILAVLLCVYVVIPIIGHVFRFTGRFFRFLFQESRDIILLPIALFVCIIKLCRALICIILARWDVSQVEMDAAKRRFIESWNRTVAIFIDNPLRVFALETKSPSKPVRRYMPVQTTSTNFEGYTIVGTLKAGGSGAKLYVARPNDGSKHVVIKSFDITSGSQLPQIVRESRAMESAKKLGLVVEHHLDNNRFWYATPYHAGEHLGVVTNILHGNKASLTNEQLKRILSYQQSLLHTLRTYHNAGLWHKDVKPDNIIIENGSAHLVDLGLVTPLGSAMTLTTHGTEYFRDPELVRQANRGVKVHQVDGSKFDVYGAGAVLYFMLENTFPAQGGLSSFSKQSPEGLRWIVRRAMADYDKRYASIDEMLKDVETVLRATNISAVRPADLPSLHGSGMEIVETSSRRLPARTTPSTGGGPFPIAKYRTKPLGLLALIVAVVVGVAIVMNSTDQVIAPQIEVQQASILDYPRPNGRVLVINELGALSRAEAKRTATNTIAQLGVAGWDIFIDAEIEASVRSWLPHDPSLLNNGSKLLKDQLAGILMLQLGDDGEIELTLIDTEGTHVFSVVHYVDG